MLNQVTLTRRRLKPFLAGKGPQDASHRTVVITNRYHSSFTAKPTWHRTRQHLYSLVLGRTAWRPRCRGWHVRLRMRIRPAMPYVPMRLTSSRLCICKRRTLPAHPGSRGRNRHQPQLSFLVETRTGGSVLAVIEALSTQVGGEGGDCSPPLLERTHAWHPYSRYGGNYKARVPPLLCGPCCSWNIPTPLSHAYLVKPLSLLPGPGEG